MRQKMNKNPIQSAESYFSENDIQVSRASFHRALSELIQKGFLAESTRPNFKSSVPQYHTFCEVYMTIIRSSVKLLE